MLNGKWKVIVCGYATRIYQSAKPTPKPFTLHYSLNAEEALLFRVFYACFNIFVSGIMGTRLMSAPSAQNFSAIFS